MSYAVKGRRRLYLSRKIRPPTSWQRGSSYIGAAGRMRLERPLYITVAKHRLA
jgi:hypothetical protein